MSYDNNGQNRRNLETIFSYSFPGSSAIEISMVKNNSPDLKIYDRQYFYFFSMTPGINKDDGSRTFDINNKVVFKQDLDRMLTIAYAIKDMANGMTSKYNTGKFTLFSDPSKTNFGNNNTGNKKILNIVFSNEKDKGPGVSITATYGNISVRCLLSIPVANAMADIIDFMCKKGLELEFSRDRNFNNGPMNDNRRPQNYNRNYHHENNNNNNNYNDNNNIFNSSELNNNADFAADFSAGFGAAINSGSENIFNKN